MSNDQPIRIVLVDDHAVVRTGIRMVIESSPHMRVVGEAANGTEALQTAEREQPDVILLDIDLGVDNGVDLLPQLRSIADQARVIVLTGVNDSNVHRRAVRLGAVGLVLKTHAPGTLLKAIEKVHAGEVWIDRVMMASLLNEMVNGPTRQLNPEAERIASLTEREREVIALICEGLQNKQLGDRISISESTVRHHLSSIFGKLGITNRLELVIYAYRHGIVRLPTR